MDASPAPPNPYEAPRADVNADTEVTDSDERYDLASRRRRWVAALVDSILQGLAFAPAALATGGSFPNLVNLGAVPNPTDSSPSGVASTLLFLGLMAVQSFFIATRGQSLGKRLLGIRILTMDGDRPTFLQVVVLRTWIPMLLPLVPFVGGALALIDVLFILGAEKRCLHDRLAGTTVVRDD